MKVGIIRCMQTEDFCPGTTDFRMIRGADSIAFASCIQKGTPIGYACPFAKRMKDVIQNDLGDGIRLIDYTH